MSERQFKGVWIPAAIWLRTDLSMLARVLWAEIDSFTTKDKACFKSNETLAKFCGCSPPSITRAIASLRAVGLVRDGSTNGRKRMLFSVDPNQIDQAGSSNRSGSLYESDQLLESETNPETIQEGPSTDGLTDSDPQRGITPERKNPNTTPKAPSPVTAVKDYFLSQHKAFRSTEYLWQFAKDGGLAKKAVAAVGLQKLTALIDAFFEDDDHWLADKPRSFGIFYSRLQRYLDGEQAEEPAETENPDTCPDCGRKLGGTMASCPGCGLSRKLFGRVREDLESAGEKYHGHDQGTDDGSV